MPTIKNNADRADLAIKVFMGVVVVLIIALISSYMEFRLLQSIQSGAYVSDEQIDANDTRQSILGLFQTITVIVSIVVFLNWFRRAYANLHRMGIDYLTYNESQAVWTFFVPILNLYRPYQIMREIWQETQYLISKMREDYVVNKSLVIIGVWWALFLLANMANNVSFRLFMNAESPEQFIDANLFSMLGDGLDIIGAIFVILTIQEVSKMEQILFEEVGIESIPGEDFE